jgi:hypothetical protein
MVTNSNLENTIEDDSKSVESVISSDSEIVENVVSDDSETVENKIENVISGKNEKSDEELVSN